MLNSEHKAVERAADANKENQKPGKKSDEPMTIFSQPSQSASKNDFLSKFDLRKRGPMSSVTTAYSMALTQQTNATANQSVRSKASQKRAKPDINSSVKVGVKRKPSLTLGKFPFGL